MVVSAGLVRSGPVCLHFYAFILFFSPWISLRLLRVFLACRGLRFPTKLFPFLRLFLTCHNHFYGVFPLRSLLICLVALVSVWSLLSLLVFSSCRKRLDG